MGTSTIHWEGLVEFENKLKLVSTMKEKTDDYWLHLVTLLFIDHSIEVPKPVVEVLKDFFPCFHFFQLGSLPGRVSKSQGPQSTSIFFSGNIQIAKK